MGFKDKIIQYQEVKENNRQKVIDNYSGLKELYNKNKFAFFISILAYSVITGLIILFAIKLIFRIYTYL
jgi:hypothetical protein